MRRPDPLILALLPEPVLRTLAGFEEAFGLSARLSREPSEPGAAAEVLYASEGFPRGSGSPAVRDGLELDGAPLTLEVSSDGSAEAEAAALALALEGALEGAREVRLFTQELTERYEEINLLYSISETLGTTLDLDDAAEKILTEVCDVLGAKRGSLWVYEPSEDALSLTAEVGDDGRKGPLPVDHPDAVTAMVFREGQPIIASREPSKAERAEGGRGDPFLSVPIRYTPPTGESRTVGVVNLIGRRHGGRFSVADQKLLSAIASQVGAALENNRLVRDSLAQERMAREMELASDLQQKLLPVAERFTGAEVSARVAPTVQVGGDFYQLFRLSEGRVGVMLGDVSLHGFPSALIMTLAISAAGIYAQESDSPARVLRGLDDALAEELETTEMFLTVFYAVIDPAEGTLVYSNAGHPHAFVIDGEGGHQRLAATDPPVGFAGPDAYGERSVPWVVGEDLLLLFTDGLPDTLAATQRGDGEERVIEAVVSHRTRSVEEIVDLLFYLTEASDPKLLSDDRTALVLRTPVAE